MNEKLIEMINEVIASGCPNMSIVHALSDGKTDYNIIIIRSACKTAIDIMINYSRENDIHYRIENNEFIFHVIG